jgi:hypothetical protein
MLEISRDIPETRNGGLFTLNFRFGPRSRLYGLIIGIDKYKSQEIPDLKGSVGDAQSMMNCLSDIYHVPADHFLFLANDGATRNAIITGFRNHLIQNNDIQRDDAIVVFYAGYGSQVVARKGWAPDGSKVETICPHDERTLDQRGQEILGIPDRTIDALLRRLASAKGDNIVRFASQFVNVFL